MTKPSSDSLADESLASLVKTGNHDAYAELIRRYQSKLHHYLYKLVSDGDEAQDLLQETFLRAYQNMQGFDESRKFSSWIYRIAHNLSINHLKKRRRSSSVDVDTLDWLADHEQELKDFIAEERRQQLSDGLIGLMDGLRPEYREALLLYYFEEKEYGEISDILHVPVSTVGVWLRRGRLGLKKIVERYEQQGRKKD